MAILFLNEVAKRLRVDYSTARDFVLTGQLQGIRLGGRRRIQVREEDLEAFIEASKMPVQDDENRGPLSGPIAPRESPKLAQIQRGPKTSTGLPHQWRERFAKK